MAGPVKGWRVLEIGCGAGALAQKLAAEGAQVTAIDASPAAVHAADHEAKEVGVVPKPEFAVADLLEPASLPRGPFDLAICVLALHESAGSGRGAARGRQAPESARASGPGARAPLARPCAAE